MTEKQKQAIKILNELWYVSHNDGMAKLKDEDYYLLLECMLDNKKYHKDYPTEEQWRDCFKNRDKPLHAQCFLPNGNGICTNPFHDCVYCPRQFNNVNTYTTTTIKKE